MAGQFYGKNPRRKRLVRDQSALNGIDFLEVSLDQNALQLHFIHNLPGETDGVPEAALPLTEKNVLISGGERIWDVRAVSVEAEKNVLEIRVNKPGDFSIYALRLIKSPQDKTCPAGFDPQLSEISFSFKMSCPGDLGCILPIDLPSEVRNELQIDYQAKDYASFRRLMLDRLSIVMPDWKERHPSDVVMTVVELLAYAGDYLSYYQDAVANEAYLETAAKRNSVRRHARILDYRVDEGCNSRLWACFEVESDEVESDEVESDEVESDESEIGRKESEAIQLFRGDRLLTRCNTSEIEIKPDPTERWKKLAFASGSVVFELLHDAAICPAHNEIHFYSWSEEVFTLPSGTTSATLIDCTERSRKLNLHAGEVLIFEEVKGTEEGGDPDPAHRHAVRLTHVHPGIDPLNGQPVVFIKWHCDDALPWPMPIHLRLNGLICKDIFCARGNVVLADQGRTVYNRDLLPKKVPENESFRPRLAHKNITFSSIYDHRNAQHQSASSCILQKSYEAVPAVSLQGDGSTWTARADLLASSRMSSHFVVEIEEDGTAFLRFGDDMFGRRPSPGSVFYATYRVGNGTSGNVGPDSIVHFVPEKSSCIFPKNGMKISKVRNPLPAQGGTEREPTDQVRFYAPHVFKKNERGVTEEDYAQAALRHPEVSGAVATLRWTGSWHTMFIAIDRKNGYALNSDFRKDLRSFIEKFRLAGHDIEIESPVFVPLHIAFTVHVKPNYLSEDVRVSLSKLFSRGLLPDGRRGFFHPDNFTFGQSVFLSQIVDLAEEVAGVLWIDADDTKLHHFHRWGKLSQGEILNGVIPIGSLEIARLDNDPNAPENGKIEFLMEGGL